MLTKPTTEDEWTIHSINIHGFFFERWCQKIVKQSGDWMLISNNYPVEAPAGGIRTKTIESNLDILASSADPTRVKTLLIECKKSNPELANWVFFPKQRFQRPISVVLPRVMMPELVRGIQGSPRFVPFVYNDMLSVSDEARETRADYATHKSGNITKTANNAIGDAAYQIALATQALINKEFEIVQVGPLQQKFFFPTIVTTANLYTCVFSADDVSPSTGEIPFSKASLQKENWLIYEYAVPMHLQSRGQKWDGLEQIKDPEIFNRMHIFVVNSQYLPRFLNTLAKMPDELFREKSIGIHQMSN